MRCSNCGAENAPGRKFCLQCGTALSMPCPSCGSPNEAGARFCGECGSALAASPGTAPAPIAAPAAERRLVSVLFVDLVGFTAASEQRDPEQVRELLTEYFETGRRLVELYGGSLEKFIGDALMAVWGTPVANEDDAERAVRAGLDVIEAVQALGESAGVPGLRARGAVMTGEAAVTLGATGQGMVAGDLVNSASRVQSLAEPGAVLVSDATRRTTEAAIVYEDAGSHTVKGKEEQVHLWRALRVVAFRGGSQRTTGLEPPFVGRERELRLIKELFHASTEERKAHLVSVTGIAGIGKSRLGWEFVKYLDGLAMVVRYASGRCLAYGEGVSYWALAEMVRRRADIVEGEAPDASLAKLRTLLADTFTDEEERRWIEPRLALLIGAGEAPGSDRQDLFAAWRRFFERLAEDTPLVLLFEDMQWADPALLEFIDHVLDWSRAYPLFVMSLGRPSPAERGLSGGRNLTQLHLEPLSERAMSQLVGELVPGLPTEVLRRIVERADGVPLYAVETIRMLLDRGLLIAEGTAFRLAGALQELDVPESLHGLIAARLDGLTADERRLVQDAAVLGKTFTAEAVSHLQDRAPAEVEPLLVSLVRKDVLAVQADPRSPERGQYGFVQDLVREVAYETLSRHDRRERHLRVARYLETGPLPEAEIAEVLASHYEEAFKAAPDAAGAGEIRARAREMFVRAGERAESLGAPEPAQAYFERALPLTDEPREQANLHDRAGEMAMRRSLAEPGISHFEQSIRIYQALELDAAAAVVTSHLANAHFYTGSFLEAIDRLEEARLVLSQRDEGPALATVEHQLGRLLVLNGQLERGLAAIERALTLAERFDLPEVLADAFCSKGVGLLAMGRVVEAELLTRKALEIGETYDLHAVRMRSLNNLAVAINYRDGFQEEAEQSARFLAYARRMGERIGEVAGLAGAIFNNFLRGDWDVSVDIGRQVEELVGDSRPDRWGTAELVFLVYVHLNRGDLDAADKRLEIMSPSKDSDNPELRAGYDLCQAMMLSARGRHQEALELLAPLAGATIGMAYTWRKYYLDAALEVAFRAADIEAAGRFLAIFREFQPGQLTPYAQATRDRYEARLLAAQGVTEGVDATFRAAAALFLEMGLPFHQAATRLEHAEWLLDQGRTAETDELLAEAEPIFTGLRAVPWLDRLSKAKSEGAVRAR